MDDILTQRNIHNDKDNWRFHRQRQGMTLLPHWHTNYEILLIYKGDVSLLACKRCLPLKVPCIILYRPFTLHGLIASPEHVYDRSMVNYTAADMALFSDKLLSMSFMGDLPLLIIPLNEQQTQEFDVLFEAIHKNLWDFTENRLYIALIIYKIYQEAEKQGLLSDDSLHRNYISGVLQYMSENLSEPLHLEATAKRFGVGRTKLNNDLRTVTGMTFKEYLTEFRMSKAKELMHDGCSVAWAASECGYSSESNFIAAYHRRWGCTPAQTKKKETD